MKKSLFTACFCLFSILAADANSNACTPGSSTVRPAPSGARPIPVLPNPAPVPANPGGQSNLGQGDQVIWDLAPEEKARIRAAAKAKGNARTTTNIRR